jgi:signal transduction histidine kinase
MRRSFPVDCRLPEAVEDAIYRAAREGLDNVSRHARARSVVVELRLEPGGVTLCVEDDGHGFNGSAPISSVALLRTGHFGLACLRERAEQLGGSLEMGRRRGSGARLCVRLPCVPLAEMVEAKAA